MLVFCCFDMADKQALLERSHIGLIQVVPRQKTRDGSLRIWIDPITYQVFNRTGPPQDQPKNRVDPARTLFAVGLIPYLYRGNEV